MWRASCAGWVLEFRPFTPQAGSVVSFSRPWSERKASTVVLYGFQLRPERISLSMKPRLVSSFVLSLPVPSLRRASGANVWMIESTHPFPDFVVASGSLPPGAPDDFYARAARMTRERGGKLALDTSGRPLEMALAEGVYLVKPNLNELRQLTGSRSDSQTDWESWCRRIITEGQADVVALTLGDKGALLATDQGVWRAPALDISAISTVGAGDSFLGGMIWSLASNHSLETAFRYGAAAGSAALLSLGRELCHADDVVRLFPQVSLRRC